MRLESALRHPVGGLKSAATVHGRFAAEYVSHHFGTGRAQPAQIEIYYSLNIGTPTSKNLLIQATFSKKAVAQSGSFGLKNRLARPEPLPLRALRAQMKRLVPAQAGI
jgi:hypothetical protein